MQADLLIDNIGELVTAESESGALRGGDLGRVIRLGDAALACFGGRVVAFGKRTEVKAQLELTADATIYDAGGGLVTPGLVDSHTHLIFDGNRSAEFLMRCQGKTYAEIAAAGGGIVASMRATRDSSLDRLVSLGELRLQRLLQSGTTTCEIKTGYGLSLESELRMLQAIMQLRKQSEVEVLPTFMPAHAVPTGSNKEEYVDHVIKDMLPAASRMVTESAVPTFVDIFCDRGYFTLDDTRAVFDAALGLGFSLKVHADEFVSLGATALACKYGAASCDHLLNVSEEEMTMLGGCETVAVLLPGTSFYLGLAAHAPARRLVEKGAIVAIASDYNPGSCHIFSLPFIWGLSCLHLKLTVEEALNALTVNAAYALKVGDRLGRLSPGYQADIAVYQVPRLEEVPYNMGWNPIKAVFKKGRLVHNL